MLQPSEKYLPSFCLVYGYIPNAEGLRNTGYPASLENKYSVVLNTYNPEIGEMYFDFHLFIDVLTVIVSGIEFDSIHLHHIKDKVELFNSVRDLIEYFTSKLWYVDENECDFSLITLYKNDSIVLTIFPEDYRSGGGPFPYHDSVTYTVLYTDIVIEEINARFRKLCESKQYSLSDIIYGLDKPHISITEKIKNLFR